MYSNDQSLWGKARIAAYRDSLDPPNDAAVGVLTIPSVDLEAPIFEDTAERTLNRGIGRIEGTAAVSDECNLGRRKVRATLHGTKVECRGRSIGPKVETAKGTP